MQLRKHYDRARIALALAILLTSEKNAMKTCYFSRLGHEKDGGVLL